MQLAQPVVVGFGAGLFVELDGADVVVVDEHVGGSGVFDVGAEELTAAFLRAMLACFTDFPVGAAGSLDECHQLGFPALGCESIRNGQCGYGQQS